MTFLDNKKIFFSLIDEYAPGSQYFTDDEDARIKCANLYAPNYEELAGFRTRKKLKEIEVKQGEGYERIKLPQVKQIGKIIGMDSNNKKTSINFYTLGEFLFVEKDKDVKVVIEFTPFLNPITPETEDDFELEIDQDLQAILPYKVASDLFKTDPGEDYTAFEREYQRRLQLINTSTFGISANITEGEI